MNTLKAVPYTTLIVQSWSKLIDCFSSDPLTRKLARTPALVAVLSLVLLQGCASISGERMASSASVKVAKRHPVCVHVAVTGGGKERFGGMEEAEVAPYEAALKSLIVQSKVFSGICQTGEEGLRLEVAIFKGSQEVNHIMKYTQTIPANWRLVDPKTRAVLFQERIDGIGTSKKFSGASRTVLATERAMQDSIVKGLEKLSQLDIGASR